MRTSILIVASLAAHVGAVALVSRKAKEIERKQTLIEVVEQKKKEEAKKNEPPPKPVEAPREVLAPKQLAPAPTPAPAENQPSEQMKALPEAAPMSASGAAAGPGPSGGGGEGTGGAGGGAGTGGGAGGGGGPVEKKLTRPSGGGGGGAGPDLAAEIAAWKPKPTARVKPVYPDEARASEIEGTVVVEATIDCTGKVSGARVVSGLGHGLDQAAIAAIQKTEFSPAPRCAPGVQKTMKINYAFRLGD